MYPDLSYLVNALTGIEPDNGLSIVKTFGLMLIMAFLASAYFLRLELLRKEKDGVLKPSPERLEEGLPATPIEILTNALLGFFLGFKIVYIFGHFPEFQSDTAGVILSALGSLPGGIVGAAILGFWKYWDSKKNQLAKPVIKTVMVAPYQRVGDITIVAAISGIIGAKLAAMFESVNHIKAFFADPLGQLLSGSGLAIYGGLILAFITVLWYVRKKGMSSLHIMDACAPAIMVGYGVGRIGCQLSGDGDWGIVNTAPPPSWWFLPDSLWAHHYPHNVLNEGEKIASCAWNYCSQLNPPVFPTPIYETVMAFIIVGILWALRKRIRIPGMLFFIYVILTAIERFYIEKIRVNPDIEIFGIQASQAEYISVLLFIVGIIGFIWTYRKK
jgi:prolipoprotein diacylglyceryl transferase